jgi:hypothetical protein
MSAARPGSPAPSGWPEEYRACLREAVAGAPALMRDLLDQVRRPLRSRLPGRSAALRQLDRFAPLLADGFQAWLGRAVEAPPPVPSSFAWPPLPADADAAEARRYRAETEAADAQFAEFDMLWVAAVPLEAVGRQPLHPASYLAALQAAVELADVQPDLHQLWSRQLRSALPGRLAGVYLRLAAGLEAAGVQPTSAEERRVAHVVAVDSPVVQPVDLASFSERFAQLFEQTQPPDTVFGDPDPPSPAPPQRPDSLLRSARSSPDASSPPARPGPAAPSPADAGSTAASVAPGMSTARMLVEGAWLELLDDEAAAAAEASRWQAWQVVWQGAGHRLWLLRDADGRSRSLTRAVLHRLQRAGRLRLR